MTTDKNSGNDSITLFSQNGIVYELFDVDKYKGINTASLGKAGEITSLCITLRKVNLYRTDLYWHVRHAPQFDYQNCLIQMIPIGTSVCLYDISFEILAYHCPTFTFYNSGDELVLYLIGYFW